MMETILNVLAIGGALVMLLLGVAAVCYIIVKVCDEQKS